MSFSFFSNNNDWFKELGMDDFIFNLADQIADCVHCRECHKGLTIKPQALKNAINNSLGENARRMLTIGIVQDELVKLGFKPNSSNPAKWDNFVAFASNTTTVKRINIFFGLELVNVSNRTYSYNSPTLRKDVINKVKELIK